MAEFKQGKKIKVQADKVKKYYWYSSDFLDSSVFEIVNIFFSPLNNPTNPDDEKQNVKVASCKCVSVKSYSLFQFELTDIELA